MGKVFAVGVGPGSPLLITEEAKKIILDADYIIGYQYTLNTIQHLLDGKQVIVITMKNQESAYTKMATNLGEKSLVVPFTGDSNFSESEVVDRLIEIFGNVTIIPGISAIQVAASRSRVPIDKARILTMHVTGSIEYQKREMVKALSDEISVIIIPRPWPNKPENHFMQSEIAHYLADQGFDTASLQTFVYENLTTDIETEFVGVVKDLEGKEFSDLSIMVINKSKSKSYLEFD
ncbi:MAG: precorrin-6y C5,15-methyltransferase (decarboxylating) subunit CbiE [Candidatus Nitrosoabyssus spongiisocia]|nr:MAG: precorrin-6y C5,15-methyltransferase (decarboxylating) subunit CbiE [Nitrosopumilaceae archaeon AB1(1)]